MRRRPSGQIGRGHKPPERYGGKLPSRQKIVSGAGDGARTRDPLLGRQKIVFSGGVRFRISFGTPHAIRLMLTSARPLSICFFVATTTGFQTTTIRRGAQTLTRLDYGHAEQLSGLVSGQAKIRIAPISVRRRPDALGRAHRLRPSQAALGLRANAHAL